MAPFEAGQDNGVEDAGGAELTATGEDAGDEEMVEEVPATEDAEAVPPVVVDAGKDAPAEEEEADETPIVEEVGVATLIRVDLDDESPACEETGVEAPWEGVMIVTEDPLDTEETEEAVLAAEETADDTTVVIEEADGGEDAWVVLVCDGWIPEEA